jgi:hypothetical protein
MQEDIVLSPPLEMVSFSGESEGEGRMNTVERRKNGQEY